MFTELQKLIQALREKFGDRLQEADFIIIYSESNIKLHIPFKDEDALRSCMGVLIFDRAEYDILLDDALKQIDAMITDFESRT